MGAVAATAALGAALGAAAVVGLGALGAVVFFDSAIAVLGADELAVALNFCAALVVGVCVTALDGSVGVRVAPTGNPPSGATEMSPAGADDAPLNEGTLLVVLFSVSQPLNVAAAHAVASMYAKVFFIVKQSPISVEVRIDLSIGAMIIADYFPQNFRQV